MSQRNIKKNIFFDYVHSHWRQIVTAVPYIWLVIFFLLPFLLILKISLAEMRIASPPISTLFEWGEEQMLGIRLFFGSYAYILEDPLYVEAYLNSIKIAAVSTIFCLIIGYPLAYGISRVSQPLRTLLLFLVILPFWTSFLLRIYAWTGLLSDQGSINDFLLWLGFISEPIRLIYTEFAVYIGIIYGYLPFMVLPLYANIEKLDRELLDAASDLGAKPFSIFLTVILPLTRPGIFAGCFLVFVPAIGEFVIPDLLGGGNVLMIGKVLSSEFNDNSDWPVTAAIAVVMLIPVLFLMSFYYRNNK